MLLLSSFYYLSWLPCRVETVPPDLLNRGFAAMPGMFSFRVEPVPPLLDLVLHPKG